jgi:hypothetical protein
MRRYIFIILFFCIIGNIAWAIEKEKLPIITDIGFIKKIPDKAAEPPGELSIGITITNDVFYKLLHESTMIKGGILKKGFNLVSIEAENFFKASGTHVYILETKADQYRFKYEITIDIQLEIPADEVSPAPSAPAVQSSPKSPPPVPTDPEESIESDKKAAPIQYDLSLYKGGPFIARSRKEVDGIAIDSSMKGIKKAIDSGPQYPTNPANPAAMGIPIFPLIKAILGKKRTSALPQPRVIRVVFVKEDKTDVLKEVNAVIRLQSRVIKNNSSQQL